MQIPGSSLKVMHVPRSSRWSRFQWWSKWCRFRGHHSRWCGFPGHQGDPGFSGDRNDADSWVTLCVFPGHQGDPGFSGDPNDADSRVITQSDECSQVIKVIQVFSQSFNHSIIQSLDRSNIPTFQQYNICFASLCHCFIACDNIWQGQQNMGPAGGKRFQPFNYLAIQSFDHPIIQSFHHSTIPKIPTFQQSICSIISLLRCLIAWIIWSFDHSVIQSFNHWIVPTFQHSNNTTFVLLRYVIALLLVIISDKDNRK